MTSYGREGTPHNGTRSNDKAIPLPLLSFRASALIVFTVAVVCFANSYDGEFVFDDMEAILNNKDVLPTKPFTDVFIHDFWGRRLTNTSHKSYRPITVLTFRWSYWLADGFNPMGFHIANIVLHAVVSVLMLPVFDLLLSSCYTPGNTPSPLRQLNTPRASLVASLMFASHPVHTESVSACVGRADLLCALFFILSFLSYVKSVTFEQTKRPASFSYPWMALSVALCCLATFSKEQGITALGVIVAFDILAVCEIDLGSLLGLVSRSDEEERTEINGNQTKKDNSRFEPWKVSLAKRVILLVVVTNIILSVRFKITGFSPPVFQVHDNPHSFVNGTLYRALNYNYLWATNLWMILSPHWLCFDWSMGCVPTITSLSDPRLVAVVMLWCVGVVAVWGGLCGGGQADRRILTLALAVLVIPFLPASNLLLRVGFVVAERVLYLPLAGLCVLVTHGITRLCQVARWRGKCMAGYYFLLVVFIVRSMQRSSEWREGMTLYRSGVKVCPLNAKIHYNIGKLLADEGKKDEAIDKYRYAIELNPVYDQAMNNLGNALKDKGEEGEAEGWLDMAVDITPEFAAAWMNRGIVKAALKKYPEAELSYKEGIRHRRHYPDCYYNLGNMYLELNMSQKALDAYLNATRLKPTHWNSWNNAVMLLDNLNEFDKAIQMGHAALKHLPNDPGIMYILANVYGKKGEYSKGEKLYREAINLDPRNPNYHMNLGVLYHRWGKLKEAEREYGTSLKLSPNNPTATTNLNMLRQKMGS